MTNAEIVSLAVYISGHFSRSQMFHHRAASMRDNPILQSDIDDAEIFEIEAAREDDEICQLCHKMKCLIKGVDIGANQ
jgi:hypothetical protein